MFMHEYKVLTTAPSAEHLRRSLKSEEFEKYGEPFTPEFVYEAIRRLPRFASMRVCACPFFCFPGQHESNARL